MNHTDDENMQSHVNDVRLRPLDLHIEDIIETIVDYKFTDLFDLSEIQGIQDAFSSATGVASIITDVDGTPITKPSNFCSFCNDIVRKSEKGLENCLLSDAILGSPIKDGPRIQKCLSGGLFDGGASIMIGDKHIANWLIGQILDSDYSIDDMLLYADKIDVDRKVLTDALENVTRMPKEQFTKVCDFLYLMAKQLSYLAIKNILQSQEIDKRKLVEQEITELNDHLEKNVLERTIQLEEANSELEETNAMLEEEIDERQKIEESMKIFNVKLENKVLERTSQLQDMNAILEEEISDKVLAESELNKERFFTDAVLHSVPGLLYLYDDKGKLVRWNKKHEEMTGYSSDELTRFHIYDWYKDDERSIEAISFGIQKTLLEGYGEAEANLQTKNGPAIPMYFTSVRLELDGRIYFTGIGIDITDLKKREDECLYIGYHDVLTGLYNRRFYEEEIKRLDTESNLPISIIMGDVNGLKMVNDAFGHFKGDELLQKAATTIQSVCRSEDVVARWGGDEFVILLPKTNPDEVEKIVDQMKKLYLKEQINSLSVSISFGWDTKSEPDEDLLEVLKGAEDYMYKHKIVENENVRGNTIKTIINTLHEKNPREEQHSKRVSEICQNIGKAIELTEVEINQLKVVGLLHDIGKIAIDEGILNKKGKLTNNEWDEIKRHPDIGYRILSSSSDMLELADCILAHHERWDGNGYPKGLKGKAIPKIARIIALADCYDAMTSERSYRAALSEEEAYIEIRKNAGTQFDPEITRTFIEKILEKSWETL